MGHGVPELVLELNGQTWTLDPSRSYTLGRDPQGDLVLQDARVSWRHATLRWSGRSWVLKDQGSTNGTYAEGRRIHELELGPGAAVHLGNAADGPRLSVRAATPAGVAAPGAEAHAAQAHHAATTAPQQHPHQPPAHHQPQAEPGPGWSPQPQSQSQDQPQAQPQSQGRPQQAPYPQPSPDAWQSGQQQPCVPPQSAGPDAAHGAAAPVYGDRSPTTFHQVAVGRVMRIGRALENELVVSDLQVSRHHAEFRATADGRFEIVDLGSHNGTYVNGQPVSRQIIGTDDIVGVGHSTFRLVGDRLEEFVDTGAVSFSARRLTVTVEGGKQILKDVSFGVPEKSLVAVIGPSGSGKSTLLKALTGYRPADEGDVLYDSRNLYKQFAELRQRIGLVPQDDILHKELTVRKALRYAAKLRFPGDTAAAEREARIAEVLGELKLDIHADKKVTALSGGQRKRVSVALELLTKPSLIFLDEPTSGLDPGMDRDVMQLLRGLADDGRTVLVVTHSVAELALCDKLLVMAPGGSVAYFGPPEEALNFFGYDSWADVFSAFENYRDYDWSGRWRGSQHYQMYAADIDAVAPQSAAAQRSTVRPPKPQSWGSQLWTLMRRYVSVIASDRGFMGLMLALPAVIGGVSAVIPADYGLGVPAKGHFNQDAGVITLILAVGMCFAGAAGSVRELIKERVIYERERAVGLSRSAYLMSKVVVLGVIAAVQAALMCGIGFSVRTLPEQGLVLKSLPAVEMCLVVTTLGITCMMIGLVISSLVKTTEKTMPLLVMFAIVQIVFTGILFKVYDAPGVEQVAWLMPARWALAGLGTTLDLSHIMAPMDKNNRDNLDPLWTHSAGQWAVDVGVLAALGILCGFAVARLLRRHEPEVMRK
ncbi:FHA domain-containing protein [Streptomyces gamaensis]|uniref:FHA domain-containing protein n=1 Tax=Streptomyces gamaensis TaxID=1763542 RepID=A0ABW0Z3P7_9ACTN